MHSFGRSVAFGAALAMALMGAAPAQAAFDFSSENVIVTDLGGGNYSFTQAGWSGGGLVGGTFSGLDDDGDLQLDSFFGEITAFSMNFSGNGFAPAFSIGIAGLDGLVFDLDGSNLLGDGIGGFDAEGIAAYGFASLYVAGPGPLDVCGEGFECAVVASFVPEPSQWAMLIAGFGLTGAAMRRRRYRAA